MLRHPRELDSGGYPCYCSCRGPISRSLVAIHATTLIAVNPVSASTSGMEIDTSHGAFTNTVCHHHHWHASDGAGDGKDVGPGFIRPASSCRNRVQIWLEYSFPCKAVVDSLFVCSAAVVWVNPKKVF